MTRSPLRRFRHLLLPFPFLLLGSCGLLVHEPDSVPTIVRRTVAPGDVLRVRDLDRPEPPVAVLTVDSWGDVVLPDLGSTLPVAGCTAEDVEAVLASFSDRPSLRLSVEILPPRSRYWLYGEVGQGGRRALRPGTTVSQAITAANPRTARADLTQVRILRGPEDPFELVVDLEAAALDAALDLPLQDGDVLLVPPRGAGNSTVVGLSTE